MRFLLVSVSLLLVVAALGLAPGAIAAPHPRLALDGMRPLTVAGKHFRPYERVRLVLHQPSGAVRRHARAGSRGAFRKAFRGVTVDRCRGFWVSAKGSAGSRARVVRRALPECAPS